MSNTGSNQAKAVAFEIDADGLASALRFATRAFDVRAERKHVVAAADGAGVGLASHAYVRYLGGLCGDQIPKRRLAKTLALSDRAPNFYTCPKLTELAAFKRSYIHALDRLGYWVEAAQAAAAALAAFQINIEISVRLQRVAAVSALEPR